MSVNKVILIGNLGQNPELRHTSSGTAVVNLRIATNERRKQANGEWGDHTEWHSVVVFGRRAENVKQYLRKGRQVFIEGRLQTRKWTDKNGTERYNTEIVAENVVFTGTRAPDQGTSQSGSSNADQAKAGAKAAGNGGGYYSSQT